MFFFFTSASLSRHFIFSVAYRSLFHSVKVTESARGNRACKQEPRWEKVWSERKKTCNDLPSFLPPFLPSFFFTSFLSALFFPPFIFLLHFLFWSWADILEASVKILCIYSGAIPSSVRAFCTWPLNKTPPRNQPLCLAVEPVSAALHFLSKRNSYDDFTLLSFPFLLLKGGSAGRAPRGQQWKHQYLFN